MTTKHFLGLLGFAFVAAWIAFNFGYALLCLVGAGAFYAIAAVLEGELDLGEVQQRLRSPSGQREPVSPAPAPTARTGRVR
jgi:hypothetical protein